MRLRSTALTFLRSVPHDAYDDLAKGNRILFEDKHFALHAVVVRKISPCHLLTLTVAPLSSTR